MLGNVQGDAYYLGMKQSYDVLRYNLELQPMDVYLWKYLRLRPRNFPDIRIAQFAWMLDNYPGLFYRLTCGSDPAAFILKMVIGTSRYWMAHYRLNKYGQWEKKIMGKDRLSGLLINAVVPVLSAFMHEQERTSNLRDVSYIPLRLPVENNRIIRIWRSFGIPVRDGLSSQAILQLTKRLDLLK
jgi:hypothetical protein